jgi:hypothetical protein
LPGIRFAFLRAEDALASGALLPRAFCPQGRWLIHLLYQPEADCFAARIASRKPITCTYKNVVRLPMSAVHHLINAALDAECTRKKILSGTDAFHGTSSLEPAARKGRVRANSGECEVRCRTGFFGCLQTLYRRRVETAMLFLYSLGLSAKGREPKLTRSILLALQAGGIA